MNRYILSGVLAIGLASFLLSAPSANAAGFVQKTVQCPKSGITLIPVGERVEIEDIIVSSDGITDVQIFFTPPKLTVLTLFLDANESVVTNFQGQVESEEEEALKLSCGGGALIAVTVVGQIIGL